MCDLEAMSEKWRECYSAAEVGQWSSSLQTEFNIWRDPSLYFLYLIAQLYL